MSEAISTGLGEGYGRFAEGVYPTAESLRAKGAAPAIASPSAPEEGRPVDLREDGLLWLINREVFHARGYALACDPETGRFALLGDGREPWKFALPEDYEQERFEAVRRVLR